MSDKLKIPSPGELFEMKKRAIAEGKVHDSLGLTTDPESSLAIARTARRMFFHEKFGGQVKDIEAWIECAAHATHLPIECDESRTAIVRELASAYVALEILSADKLDPSVRNGLKTKLALETRYDYREAVADLLANDRAAIEAEIKTALKEKKHDEVG